MNEIATIDEATQLPSLPVPKAARGMMPRSPDEALRYAMFVCEGGLAPDSYKANSREEMAKRVALGILKGAEIGLPPMTALANIAIINGRPCLWGDGAVALAHASGNVEYMKEWLEGENDDRKAVCEIKRRDQTAPVRRTFSVNDAKRARLWGNPSRKPWILYPQRMLAARARSWALRDAFADVLSGLGIREEIEDMTPAAEPEAMDLSFLDDDGGALPETTPGNNDDNEPPMQGEPRKKGTEAQANGFLANARKVLAGFDVRDDVDAYERQWSKAIAEIKHDWPEIGGQIEALISARRDELPPIAA